MTLPKLITQVSYFDNAYRGDLVISHGVLYYFPWVNVALEQKQTRSDQLVRLFPLDLAIDLAGVAIKAISHANEKSKLEELGLWRPDQTDEALKARLDAYIADQRTKPPLLVDYEYGLPQPMRFAAGEIKNLSLTSGLRFDTDFDSHDFDVSAIPETWLFDTLEEAGFISEESSLK
jgi:hypothetical protein